MKKLITLSILTASLLNADNLSLELSRKLSDSAIALVKQESAIADTLNSYIEATMDITPTKDEINAKYNLSSSFWKNYQNGEFKMEVDLINKSAFIKNAFDNSLTVHSLVKETYFDRNSNYRSQFARVNGESLFIEIPFSSEVKNIISSRLNTLGANSKQSTITSKTPPSDTEAIWNKIDADGNTEGFYIYKDGVWQNLDDIQDDLNTQSNVYYSLDGNCPTVPPEENKNKICYTPNGNGGWDIKRYDEDSNEWIYKSTSDVSGSSSSVDIPQFKDGEFDLTKNCVTGVDTNVDILQSGAFITYTCFDKDGDGKGDWVSKGGAGVTAEDLKPIIKKVNSEDEFAQYVDAPTGSKISLGGKLFYKIEDKNLKGGGFWADKDNDIVLLYPEQVNELILGDIEDLFDPTFMNQFTNVSKVKIKDPQGSDSLITFEKDNSGNWYASSATLNDLMDFGAMGLNDYLIGLDTSTMSEPKKSNIESIKASGGVQFKSDGLYYQRFGDTTNGYYWKAKDGQVINSNQFKYVTDNLDSLPDTTIGDRVKLTTIQNGITQAIPNSATYKDVGNGNGYKWILDGVSESGSLASLISSTLKSEVTDSDINNLVLDISNSDICSSGNGCYLIYQGKFNDEVVWKSSDGKKIVSSGNRDIATTFIATSTINLEFYLGLNDCGIGTCNGVSGAYAGATVDNALYPYYFATSGDRKYNLIDAIPYTNASNFYSTGYSAILWNGANFGDVQSGDVILKGADINGATTYYVNGQVINKDGYFIPQNKLPSGFVASSTTISPSGGVNYVNITSLNNFSTDTNLDVDYPVKLNGDGITNVNITRCSDYSSNTLWSDNCGDVANANYAITNGSRSDLPAPNSSNRKNITKKVGSEANYAGGVVYSGNVSYFEWFYSATGTITNGMLDGLPVNANWGDENFDDIVFSTYESFNLDTIYVGNNLVGSVSSLGYVKYCYFPYFNDNQEGLHYKWIRNNDSVEFKFKIDYTGTWIGNNKVYCPDYDADFTVSYFRTNFGNNLQYSWQYSYTLWHCVVSVHYDRGLEKSSQLKVKWGTP